MKKQKKFLISFLIVIFTINGLSFISPVKVRASNVPPSTVTDLAAFNVGVDSIDLSWTAPSDDSMDGKAYYYDLRYDTAYFTEATWLSGTQVEGTPIPASPGTYQNMLVGSLMSNTTYYFAIKSVDQEGNVSGLSNITQATTLASDGTPSDGDITPPPTYSSVSGKITDYNNQSVSGAFIDLHNVDYTVSRGAMSDSEGNYYISGIEAGTYTMEVYPPDGSTGLVKPPSVDITLMEGESLGQDFQFSEAMKTIKGVVALSDGTAITDAMVEVYKNGTDSSRVSTDSSGNYVLKVAGGTWWVYVHPQNPDTADWFYDKPSDQVTFAQDQTSEERVINFTVSSKTVLPTKAGITGKITDYAGGPIKDVWVDVHTLDFSFQRGSSTNLEGEYLITDLEPGTYMVEVFLPPELMGLIMPSPFEVSLPAGETLTKNIELLQATKTITGRVTYSSGIPVADAMVNVFKEYSPGWAETSVDSEGYYTLKIGGGSWMLMVHPKDPMAADWYYTEPPIRVTFADDQIQEKEVVNITITKTDAAVKGIILNPDGSIPVPYTVRVHLSGAFGPGGEGDLMADGSFYIPVAAGNYTLFVFCEDPALTAPETDPFSVASGEILDVGAIYLIKKAEHIKGKVTDPEGKGVSNVAVEAFRPEGRGFNRTITDAFGNYDIFVTEGEWMITVIPPFDSNYAYSEPPQKVAVGTGETVYKNFTLVLADATISGVVKDASGNVLSDVYGWAFVEKETLDTEMMGPEPMMVGPSFGGPIDRGTFSFNVPAGTYQVGIHLPPEIEYTPGPFLPVTVASGETANVTIKVKSKDATIRGFIKDSTGKVLTGLMVHVFVSGEGGLYQEGLVDTLSGEYVINVAAGQWYLGFHIDPASGYMTPPPPKEAITIVAGQTITKNIVLVKGDSIISGRVTDAASKPLPHVWVSADTRSFSEGPPEDLSVSFFGAGTETGSEGKFKFVLPQGTYYIHAFLPPELGLINPEEQKVIVSPDKPAFVNLVFRKRDSEISGKVYLNEVGTSAFVWAWSNEGGFAETKADSTGSYKLNVVKDDVWHIGAAKETGTEPYRSDEIIVDMTDKTHFTQDLFLKKIIIDIPESVSVTTDAATPRAVSVAGGASVSIPANAIATEGSVTVTIDPEIELPSQGISKVVGVGYDIEARDDKGQVVESFNMNVTVSLPYKDEQLVEAKVSADDLSMAFWDETSALWRSLENSVVNKTNRLVTASTNHFTRFAIVAPADVVPPSSPSNVSVMLAAANTLRISWENPISDFHHAKIYRSVQEGDLGKIVFNDVFTTSQKDSGLEKGEEYFYTVRAVDPAGNESTNTDQVSATITDFLGEEVIEPGPEPELKGQLTRNLKIGMRGDDVKILQQFLITEGVYPEALVTGYFGPLTFAAVVRFQEKYTSEVLAPFNITKGTGFVGTFTRKKINEILGE